MNPLLPRHALARSLIWAGMAAIVSSCATVPGEGGRTVQIQRTTHGVAHITAADYTGIGYGVGYAHAQDNVCQTANQLVTVRGERSRYFGGAASGLLGLRLMSNEQIDFFIRLHMDDAVLARAYAGISADALATAQGQVAGYNRWLADTGVANLPQPCRGAPWVRPMTLADLYRMQELSMIQIGIGIYADAVLAAKPPGANAVAMTAPLSRALAKLDNAAEPEMLGSNGWAFGKDTTPDGRGLLLGNPHFPWAGANRFWQLHLVIPGKLDVMGVSIGGAAMVQVGFNKDVAWTHTVSTGKRFTLHELTLDPADPTAYILDGKSRKMAAREIAIESLGADGKLVTRRQTFWHSVWGPMLMMPRMGLGWTGTTAYAIKDANAGNTRFADAWLAMNKARNVDDLRAAISGSSIPWANTIAADRDGRAMYADLSVVPDIRDEQMTRCAASKPAAALATTADLVVLDGSRSQCDWYRDPKAPVPGLIPAERMPVLVTDGWVQNSNDSYWLSNPDTGIAGISSMLGRTGIPQRLRTRSGIEEIRARLAGADGLPGNRMGMAELQTVILRNRNKAAQLVVDDLLAACAGESDPDVRAGCAALKGWNYRNDVDARGAPLFKEFWRVASEIPKVWRIPFDPTNAVNTPAGLNLRDNDMRAKVMDTLGKAVRAMKKAGFPADATLGSVQYRAIGQGRIPVHGGAEYEGVLNKIGMMGPAPITESGFIVDFGTSYIQTVTFDDRGPIAQAVLTYGQSSDPASPHANDQLPAFSRKQWFSQPYHPQDISAQATGAPTLLRY